ncbi:hypothetical protein ABE50_30760 [Bacillus wiedmannii]|nr:hypothetical protein [Bacillus wiedmannii]
MFFRIINLKVGENINTSKAFSDNLLLEIDQKMCEIESLLIQSKFVIDKKRLLCIQKKLNECSTILSILKQYNTSNDTINKLAHQLNLIHISFTMFCHKL